MQAIIHFRFGKSFNRWRKKDNHEHRKNHDEKEDHTEQLLRQT